MPSTTSPDLTPASVSTWLFVGLVALVVVVDGTLGAAAFDPIAGALAAIPIDYGLLRVGLAALAVVAVVVGTVAAGLRSPAYAALGLLALPVAFAYGVTGLVLPWDQFSFWLAQSLLELVLAIPVLGEVLAGVLFGGVTLGRATLQRAFLIHYGIVVLAAVALVVSLVRTRVRPPVRAQTN